MTLTVRKPNGGTVVKQYTLEHGVYNTPYQTGDIVYRFRGTKFPMISERPGSVAAPRVCVCCGDIQDLKEETICFHCGKSIIEATDTVKH